MNLLPKRTFWIALAIASASILTFLNTVDAQILDDNSWVETQTFLDWCLQYDELLEATQYSVQYLLENAETNDCYEASQTLTTQTALRNRGPSVQGDFRPFASLTAVTDIKVTLWVQSSTVVDFAPLNNLPALERLEVSGRIYDLTPFSALENLDDLTIRHNVSSRDPSLQDLSPLTSLDSLRLLEIHTSFGAISDLTPLSELRNLEELGIY